MKVTKKTGGILAAVLVVLVAVFGLVYYFNRPAAQSGSKNIVVTVVLADESSEDIKINTDAEYLRGAMEEKGIVGGSESEYGLWVTTVNGVTADDSKQEWWCFYKDGEMLNTGVDSTPIADGDHFEVVLTVGYDNY